jgi:hypothetical protein
MVTLAGDKVVKPSEFPDLIESGMTIETIMILRKRTTLGDQEKRCPRCSHIIKYVTMDRDWNEWEVSSIPAIVAN